MGFGCNVDQAPVDLNVSLPLAHSLDRETKWLVLQQAAIYEPTPVRRERCKFVRAEEAPLELLKVDGPAIAEPSPKPFEAHGREGARDG